jgi:RimJ/RimL family protein N-acetyltransferase
MLSDASKLENAEHINISVKADNVASRHVIEIIGFEYQEPLFQFKFFGYNKKWRKHNPANAGNRA